MQQPAATTPPPRAKKPPKVKQACDACHARKVRCDGAVPCAGCVGLGLGLGRGGAAAAAAACTYLAVPKKTGPKGRRRARTQAVLRSAMEKRPYRVPESMSSAPSTPPSGTPSRGEGDEGSRLRMSPRVSPGVWPGVAPGVIRRCLDAFFTHKYPITPMLDRQALEASLPRLADLPDQYGLVTACCAVIVLSPEIIAPVPASPSSASSPRAGVEPDLPSAEFLIAETARARRFGDHVSGPSLVAVQTSFFLFAAYFCMGRDNAAWFHLREAMAMLQLLRLHEEHTYHGSLPDAVFARRTFWVLFITERAYALQRHRPLTLQTTIALPTVEDSDPDRHVLPGFLDLISLFRNFDSDFVTVWNISSTTAAASAEALARLQSVLDFALPRVDQHAAAQQADLLVSRQWLKVIVWQLCLSKTLLSGSSPDESMSLHYPVVIARDLVRIARRLPPAALEANGVGILEKVFDVGCSLADVLSLRPAVVPRSAREVGPRDYLLELVRIVGTVLGGSSRHLGVLTVKASQCLLPGINDRCLTWRDAVDDTQRRYDVKEL